MLTYSVVYGPNLVDMINLPEKKSLIGMSDIASFIHFGLKSYKSNRNVISFWYIELQFRTSKACV